MSRIYDAIRIARETRSKTGLDSVENLGEMELPNRRVAPRMELDIDLTVYGRSDSGGPFYEKARAIRGNANGGVFLAAIPVLQSQDLLLINNGASQEQICNVLSVLVRDSQTCEISVGFPSPNADFWKPCKAAQAL